MTEDEEEVEGEEERKEEEEESSERSPEPSRTGRGLSEAKLWKTLKKSVNNLDVLCQNVECSRAHEWP